MSWNYRVVRTVYDTGEEQFAIHEAYYREDKTAGSITVDPVPSVSESVEGLRQTLQWMLDALDKPVLKSEDFDKSPALPLDEEPWEETFPWEEVKKELGLLSPEEA